MCTGMGTGAVSLKKPHHVITSWFSKVVNDHPKCVVMIRGLLYFNTNGFSQEKFLPVDHTKVRLSEKCIILPQGGAYGWCKISSVCNLRHLLTFSQKQALSYMYCISYDSDCRWLHSNKNCPMIVTVEIDSLKCYLRLLIKWTASF